MGLFSKKKEEKIPAISSNIKLVQPKLNISEFPEIHKEETPVPLYKPTLSEIKTEVKGQNLEIPERKPRIEPQRMMPFTPKIEPESYDFPTEDISTSRLTTSEKPLFIKIEKYKSAVEELESLKEKIHTTEEILNSLEDIRRKEDRQIQTWREELNKLKNKLLNIDKDLFNN